MPKLGGAGHLAQQTWRSSLFGRVRRDEITGKEEIALPEIGASHVLVGPHRGYRHFFYLPPQFFWAHLLSVPWGRSYLGFRWHFAETRIHGHALNRSWYMFQVEFFFNELLAFFENYSKIFYVEKCMVKKTSDWANIWISYRITYGQSWGPCMFKTYHFYLLGIITPIVCVKFQSSNMCDWDQWHTNKMDQLSRLCSCMQLCNSTYGLNNGSRSSVTLNQSKSVTLKVLCHSDDFRDYQSK